MSARKDSALGLRQLLDCAPGLAWRIDGDGRVDILNRRARDFTGLKEGRLARELETRVHRADRQAAASAFARTASPLSSCSIVRLRSMRGPYRWFELRSERMQQRAATAPQIYGWATDIDDHVRSREQLKLTRLAVERGSRSASVAELSASIAHEINQPLAAITNNGAACKQWLTSEPPNLSRARIAVDRIVRDARTVSEITAHVRALFRHEPPDRSPLDISRLVMEISRLFRRDCARASISLKRTLAKNLPSAFVDGIQIQQVVMNLIRNAIESMQSTRSNKGHVLHIRTARNDDGFIVVEVKDTGPGFAKPERALEPFFTTKRDGMGMGLTICRTIAEAHDGAFEIVHSSSGATVRLVLPPAKDSG
jgi:PAS domain S-box-containing protein